MSKQSGSSRAVSMLIAAALLMLPAAGALATPWRAQEAAALRLDDGGAWGALWSFLERLWSKEGAGMDPDGAPQAAPPPGSGDPDKAGAGMDPDGTPQQGGPSGGSAPGTDPEG